MVDCQPLQGRSTAAAAPSDESTPLVHPPMVCKDDCPCFDDKPSYGATGDQPAQEDEAGNTVAKGSNLIKSLSFFDRFLAVWVLLAMILGVVIGEFAPNVDVILSGSTLRGVSIPIVVGLLVMMWPILAKVQYERLPRMLSYKHVYRQVFTSLVLNWLVGPFLMLGIAWATLPDLPTYREGIILVGLARCIAMVMIWNRLAKGDEDLCAILVIINSLLQIVLYSPLSVFFINVISRSPDQISLQYGETAIAVLIYLGIPLAAGVVTRAVGVGLMGKERYNSKLMVWLGPLSLIALLYTIIIIFAEQSHRILQNLGPTFRTFVPMVLYFSVMWTGTFGLIWWLSQRSGGGKRWGYRVAVVQSFTAGSNNFELAIAVAVAIYGVSSDQALAATIGPLVEVPVLLGLTWAALWAEKRLHWGEEGEEERETEGVDTLQTCGC